MSFIEVIQPRQAAGRLQKAYNRVQSAQAQVDNVLQVHSLRPHTLEAHMAIYKAVLHHSGNQLPELPIGTRRVKLRCSNRSYPDQVPVEAGAAAPPGKTIGRWPVQDQICGR